jgi:hypothetical protein
VLKAKVVSTTYQVPIDPDIFDRVFMQADRYDDRVFDRLAAVEGVSDPEYNGLFGNNIYFTAESDSARVMFLLELAKVIEDYKDWTPPLDGETRFMVFKADTEVGCHEDVEDPEDVTVELFKAGSQVEVDVITEHPEHYFVQFGDGSVANIHKDTVDVMPEDWNGSHPVGQT